MRLRVALTILFLMAGLATRTQVAAALPSTLIPLRAQVLVIGGNPAGIAAALAAARAGMTVLLLEVRDELGGDITGAWLNTFDMNWGPNREHLTQGIFLEAYRALGQTFDVDQARAFFRGLLENQPGLTVLLRTRVVSPLLRENSIVGVVAISDQHRVPLSILADEVIDATDDAAVAVASGVPYTVGREESGLDRRMQAATLIFRLAGVDQTAVFDYLRAHEKPVGRGGAWGRHAWGYAQIASQYQPRNPRIGLFDLNLGWQTDGTVLVNAVQIYDVDGTDEQSMREGRAVALAELPSVVAFLRTAAPGFEKAVLIAAAPHLYIRETRHTIGMYRMEVDDILQGRDFYDKVAVASYPIDIHPYKPGQLNVYSAVRRVYSIPYRVLVPTGIDHLQVAGKAVSATYTAFGSLRVIPTAMALGEAAGRAAALAVATSRSPRQNAEDRTLIVTLQKNLTAEGAFIANPKDLLSASPRPRSQGPSASAGRPPARRAIRKSPKKTEVPQPLPLANQ